jgi:hypothetical protein
MSGSLISMGCRIASHFARGSAPSLARLDAVFCPNLQTTPVVLSEQKS